MKPYNMIVSAFGPYAKTVEIPFHRFGKEGIFLITGDTGAGKTSIFDALCFALFGEVSGSNREVESLRSDFALPETKTFVDFTFFHGEELYRIVRNPAYVRPKLRSDGTTTQSADAALYYPDGHVLTGYGKTKTAIEELLGIDAKQFKQIVMIAQGEFLKMLYADSNTRGQIFRRLFQTECYADFQKRLKELEKEKRIAFTDSQKRLAACLQQSGFADDLCAVEDSFQEGELWLQEEGERLSETKAVVLEMEKQIQRKIALRAQVEGEQTQRKKRKEAEETLDALEKQKTEQENLRILLEKQRKALDYVFPLEQAWKNAKQEVSLIMAEQAALFKEQEENAILLEKAEAEQREIPKRKAALEKKKSSCNAKRENLEQIKKKSDILSVIADCQKETERLSEEKAGLETAMAESEKICQKGKQAAEELAETEKAILLCTQQENALAERHKILLDTAANDKERQLLQQELEEKRKAYRVQETAWKKASLSALEAERLFLREQAGFLAETLEENAPCPVCGSTVHPHKAVPSFHAPTQEEWKQQQEFADREKRKLETLRVEGVGTKERLSLLQNTLQEQRKTLAVSSLEALRAETEYNNRERTLCKEKGQDLEQEKKKLQNIVETGKQREKILEQQKNQLKSVAEDLQRQEQTYSRLEGKRTALEEQIGTQSYEEAEEELRLIQEEIEKESADMEKTEESYRKMQTNHERKEAVLREKAEQKKEREMQAEQAEKAFQHQLLAYGFPDVETYTMLLPKREELEEKEEKNRAYFLALSSVKTRLSDLGKENQQLLQTNLDMLAEEIAALQEKKECEQAKYEEKRTLYAMRRDALSRGKQEWKVYEKEKESYYPIKELSDTVSGDISGMDRISFEQFIQGVYFEQIIEAANLRFQDMTDGRYLLLRAEESADKRVQSGLVLAVMDYFTGKQRSIKSLSGGEAFKASLCLALGLSDMIQQKTGGVQIDAMFIDEGFGSLDEQSREQAVAVLQRLSTENRLIGIISHVTELKDSIEKKIVVQKGIQGSRISLFGCV